MTSCPCELLGDRLQEPAHHAHTLAETKIRQVAAAAPRYLAALLHRKPADPVRDALIERAAQRLRSIHQAAAGYLPESRYQVRPFPRQRAAEQETAVNRIEEVN